MFQLIGQDGRAGYGCLDGPVAFNHQDFVLRGFFGRPLGSLRRRLALGGFHYLGLLGPDWLVAVAAVRLGYAAQVFGFFCDLKTGRSWERSLKDLPGRLAFPLDPDAHAIHYAGRGCRLDVSKSHAKGRLEVEAAFGDRLALSARFPCGFDARPLRVVNPSCGDPRRFTFTEKCAPLVPEAFTATFEGRELQGPAAAVYDWTAGFFNRTTNWIWGALAGFLEDGTPVGANFASLVNESCYPENAFWAGNHRERLGPVLFQCDLDDPGAGEWRVFTEDGRVDLRFRPAGGRGERTWTPVMKVNFRQLAGHWRGRLRTAEGREARLEDVPGVAEVHLSVW